MQTINGENQYTTPVLKQAGDGYDVVVSGTFEATVSVLVSKDALNWYTAQSVDTASVLFGNNATAWFVRAGVKTGDFTSGTIEIGVF